MRFLKLSGASVLLLVGFLCLGRTIETGLNQNPNLTDRREIMTAGLLIGLPTTALGGWLIWHDRQQRQRQQAQQLRAVFFDLVKAGRGQITPLRLAMAAQIAGDVAKAYLNDRSVEYDATFQVDDDGTIIYCFPTVGLPVGEFAS
ncbi:MAG: hypothetical protein ACFB0G_16120 [Leptolyngbyaceae cyanobacterium]